jgi:hypothetical protein
MIKRFLFPFFLFEWQGVQKIASISRDPQNHATLLLSSPSHSFATPILDEMRQCFIY